MVFNIVTAFLFIALIVGLINPSKVMFWSDKPTRLKVVLYYFLFMFLFGVIYVQFFEAEQMSKSDKIILAKKYIDSLKLDQADSVLSVFRETDSEYDEVKSLFTIIDSLNRIEYAKNAEKRKIENEKLKSKNTQTSIEQLKREIESINSGIDFSKFDGTIESIQMGLAMFGVWNEQINRHIDSENHDLKKLALELKQKVEKVQIQQFPVMRKKYGNVANSKLWDLDIDAKVSGKGNRILTLVGGVFAANKNKKEFQNQIHEVVKMFRFSQVRYKWYEDDDEYTYYEVYDGKDSDPVVF